MKLGLRIEGHRRAYCEVAPAMPSMIRSAVAKDETDIVALWRARDFVARRWAAGVLIRRQRLPSRQRAASG